MFNSENNTLKIILAVIVVVGIGAFAFYFKGSHVSQNSADTTADTTTTDQSTPTTETGNDANTQTSTAVKNSETNTQDTSTTSPRIALTPGIGLNIPSTVLANGNNEAVDLIVTANAKSNMLLNTIGVNVVATEATLASSAGIFVKDQSDTTLATAATAYNGGQTVISLTNGYLIKAGTSAQFKIYIPVTKVSGVMGTAYLSSTLIPEAFTWADGNDKGLVGFGSQIYGFPVNIIRIHN